VYLVHCQKFDLGFCQRSAHSDFGYIGVACAVVDQDIYNNLGGVGGSFMECVILKILVISVRYVHGAFSFAQYPNHAINWDLVQQVTSSVFSNRRVPLSMLSAKM
jgi:hypothetical protein